jgi:hypothetical protein
MAMMEKQVIGSVFTIIMPSERIKRSTAVKNGRFFFGDPEQAAWQRRGEKQGKTPHLFAEEHQPG